MDVWGSVSIEDLKRGIRILAKLIMGVPNFLISEITLVFVTVIQYKEQRDIPHKCSVTKVMKDNLMNIVDRYNKLCDELNVRVYEVIPTLEKLDHITQEEKLFLASLCKV